MGLEGDGASSSMMPSSWRPRQVLLLIAGALMVGLFYTATTVDLGWLHQASDDAGQEGGDSSKLRRYRTTSMTDASMRSVRSTTYGGEGPWNPSMPGPFSPLATNATAVELALQQAMEAASTAVKAAVRAELAAASAEESATAAQDAAKNSASSAAAASRASKKSQAKPEAKKEADSSKVGRVSCVMHDAHLPK